MNREHNILEITKSPKRSRQFLKEWKQNRPWLVDTESETGMVCTEDNRFPKQFPQNKIILHPPIHYDFRNL
jgi:hypothetical protein